MKSQSRKCHFRVPKIVGFMKPVLKISTIIAIFQIGFRWLPIIDLLDFEEEIARNMADVFWTEANCFNQLKMNVAFYSSFQTSPPQLGTFKFGTLITNDLPVKAWNSYEETAGCVADLFW